VIQITPEDIVTLIKENVARETWELGEKKFTIEPAASNQILVIHTQEVQDEIEAFLNDLRRFTTTVVAIESRFVEVTDAFLQEIGADFRGLGGVFGSSANLDDTTNGGEDQAGRGLDNLGTGDTGSVSPSSGIFFNDNSDGDIRGRTENYFDTPLGSILSTTGGGSFQFGLLDDTAFNLVVTAVDKSANALEVMAPELTVFNTERAYVTVLNEVSFLQDFDVDVANTAFIANPEIGVLQEGVVLDVRPTVSYDRKYVTLDVRTTVATIQRPIDTFETTLGGFTDAVTFQLPRLEVQNANTTVIVPDGGAVILGGLKTLNYVNRKAEVPWVARLPVIGILFRQKGVADEAYSLVILVKADIKDLSRFREATPVR
jgi:MSHA biogenesis protein MshL